MSAHPPQSACLLPPSSQSPSHPALLDRVVKFCYQALTLSTGAGFAVRNKAEGTHPITNTLSPRRCALRHSARPPVLISLHTTTAPTHAT